MTLLASVTVPWIAPRHRVDVLLTGALPGDRPVTSAFVLAVDGAGRTLLTRVERPGRSWEVPGGHVEPGETPVRAAARELAEETGLVLPPGRLRLLGGLAITLLEDAPAAYGYPPRTFMAFYAARVDGDGAPTRPAAGFEAAEAAWAGRADVAARCGPQPWLPLYEALLAGTS
ncbi:NUDIX hydrolase [Actinomadura parmotrematis]|uniref:NUDIX domain-containing protein n=1 Tax=Actinomadura parmotrematis TaxID=2864039 RepID=A0ABS7FP39_9ACTN|nr:NUDIX domain-containing protein [Actinomadura parmotrematis]MBW8482131.1 NUDIX domain-containing protein [Actinomadura parmotrematis]